MKDILETEEVSSKYYLSAQYLKTLREHRRRHEEKGHGFGYEVINNSGIFFEHLRPEDGKGLCKEN